MSRNSLGRMTLGLGIWLFAVCASGQTVTATLVGSVHDQSGAAVAGAKGLVTSRATNLSREVTGDDSGDFTITYLQAGLYQVVAEASGFERAAADQIELLVNQTARVDLALEPGAVSETVQMTTAAALVSTETSSMGQTIDRQQMADLLLKGRGFYDLALLSGAVAPRRPFSFVASRRPTPGGLNAPAFSWWRRWKMGARADEHRPSSRGARLAAHSRDGDRLGVRTVEAI